MLLFVPVVLLAQEPTTTETRVNRPAQQRKWLLGLYGNFAVIQHTADFPELPGTTNFRTNAIFTPRTNDYPGPANFQSVSASDLAFGLLAEYRVNNELSIHVRAGYSQQPATFTTTFSYRVGYANGKPAADATSEYTLQPKVTAIELSPLVGYTVWEGLQVIAGARMSFIAGTFTQKETLIAPSDGTFENNSRVRNELSGDIPDISTPMFSAVAGLCYDYPVGERLVLSPEVMYSFGLTNIVQNLSWKISDLRAGIQVKYRF